MDYGNLNAGIFKPQGISGKPSWDIPDNIEYLRVENHQSRSAA
jgi:hypothetical protein